jgi:hypothetical protein
MPRRHGSPEPQSPDCSLVIADFQDARTDRCLTGTCTTTGRSCMTMRDGSQEVFVGRERNGLSLKRSQTAFASARSPPRSALNGRVIGRM